MTEPAPVLLIVGGDPGDVGTTVAALDRRFGSDYRVLTAGSAADGVAKLHVLAGNGEHVALPPTCICRTATGSSSCREPPVCTAVSRGSCCSIWMSSTPGFRFGSCPRCSVLAHWAGSMAGW
jgi:hypothetical protein